MTQSIYPLYLVTHRYDYSHETFLSIIETACQNGVTLVQLREKTATTHEFYTLAKSVKTITDKYDIPLIINDRVDICLAVDASGIHIGDDELPISVTRKLIGKDKILGVSAHTLSRSLEAYQEGADYLGVGAIFPTSTKKDATILTLETLTNICTEIPLPVVAIGGIEAHNINTLADTGIAGISLVSAIMKSKNVDEVTQQLKQTVTSIL